MMSTTPITPYRSAIPAGRGGFAQLLYAEWTKFRTTPGWVIGTIVAALVTVLLGLIFAARARLQCAGPGGQVCPSNPIGPSGEAVNDQFYFAHQPLDGNGSITARVTSLTGLITYPPSHPNAIVSGVEPWAKAGVIIKQSARQGSAYAAVMTTGGHGVRMQYDFTHDLAGLPGAASAASPRWLRLTRAADTLTGYESPDGIHWTKVGSARLAGLPVRAQAGFFVASPGDVHVPPGIGAGFTEHLTQATATFDHVRLQGNGRHGTWIRDNVGGVPGGPPLSLGGFKRSGGRFTLSGSGDIGPLAAGAHESIDDSLRGTFAGLIVLIVLGSLFISTEYRRGLIRTTLAASPRRGRVLAAKSVVIGTVAFVTGLAAAAIAVPLGKRIVGASQLYPVSSLTQVRVIVGTAALFAVAAVLALAVATLLRQSAAAVTAVVVAIILPYVLAIAFPVGAAQWLLRLTPAAAFAIQQSLHQYAQVNFAYTPVNGYYPLPPWGGLAVLCGYAALALGLAAFLLRRRDA
jgi:ABC-type transport system involved in multi-copper enzyme maturation permease subunit